MFIDAVCIYGETRQFTTSLFTLATGEEGEGTSYVVRNGQNFVPLDLSDFSIRFKVLGSATADAEVLVEHLITQLSDIETDGQITNAANGEFTFTVTAEDTRTLDLGQHPIMLELVDVDTLTHIDTITEGGKNGEFNKLYIVQV